MWFLILAFIIIFAAAFAANMEKSRTEEKYDPCQTCNRWFECNGVDQGDCPLWKNMK